MEKSKIEDALSFTISYDKSSQSLIDTIQKTATTSVISGPYWEIEEYRIRLDDSIDINEFIKILRWASDKDFEPVNIKKLYTVIEEYKKEH